MPSFASNSPIPPAHLSEPGDAELDRYRAVSGLAVLGLMIGLLAPAAMLDSAFWIIPPAGILISSLALWRIHQQSPALIGRKAAVLGLVLSIVFGIAGPTDWLIYRYRLRSEARQFAEMYFALLRDGQPQEAYQLLEEPKYRKPLDERLWDYYRDDPQRTDLLKKYVAEPLARTLLALGSRADPRFYDAVDMGEDRGKEMVQLIYAISYDEDDGRKSFFVAALLERSSLENHEASWRLRHAAGGVRPE